MKSENSILYSLIACGIFSVLSLMTNQIAIQQESSIRNLDVEVNKNRAATIAMQEFVSKTINFETTTDNFYNSISSRFFTLNNPKYSFLSKGVCSLGGTGTLIEESDKTVCTNFQDSHENFSIDLKNYLRILVYEVATSFEDLTLITGKIEEANILKGKFADGVYEFINGISLEDYPDAIFNDDEILKAVMDHLSGMRLMINQKSMDMDSKTIDLDERVTAKMNLRQILLLVGVLFQITSLIFLLYFFKLFLPLNKQN